MNLEKVKALAQKAFEERREKDLKNEEEKAKTLEEEINNTERYVEKIINIFSASNSEKERSVFAVRVNNEENILTASVFYSSADLGANQFFEENEIAENNIGTITAVKAFNSERAEHQYMIKITDYFKKNLADFFLVSTANTIEIRQGNNL